jgi:hypothetical protein
MLSLNLSVLTFYQHIISIYTLIFRWLIPIQWLRMCRSGTPTSEVYPSSIPMQMIKEYHILWRYALLQWHNFPTKYCEYWCSTFRLRDDRYTAIQWLTDICVWRIALPEYMWDIFIHEINLRIGEKLPCGSTSSNRVFLFQSWNDVGCPVALTAISGVKDQAHIAQCTLFPAMKRCI